MNLREICGKIISLVKQIISEDEQLETSLRTSYSKVHECLNLLRNKLKQVAAIAIKYGCDYIGVFLRDQGDDARNVIVTLHYTTWSHEVGEGGSSTL